MNRPRQFHFKFFSVDDDRCAMKVGTDAVLLGAWAEVTDAKTILDVGTGCGVIALMLAQRTNSEVHIDAIEIENEDAAQAGENAWRSPWPNKISVLQKSIQEFEPPHCYDLIVSNPPYFNNSHLPPSRVRAQARHIQNLSYEELILHAVRVLYPTGKLAVILPFQEGNHFKTLATTKGLFLHRQLAFFSRKEKPQERWLFEFGFAPHALQEENLVLYETGDIKSNAYLSLTNDFYL